MIRLPDDGLVVLIGPSGSGKSTWASATFDAGQIVASDALRAIVGESEHDQRAGTDAFDVLDLIVERRLRRGLFSVVDSLGLDDEKLTEWIEMARRSRRPVHAVVFDVAAKVCRSRNRQRARPVPSKVVSSQLERFASLRTRLDSLGFDRVHTVTPDDLAAPETAETEKPAPAARVVPREYLEAGLAAQRQRDDRATLSFGLHLASFTSDLDAADLGPRLRDVATRAEATGFSAISVMDHIMQIPQVGREWEPMLEGPTTLAYLAAATRTVHLGLLVGAVTYRNPALLAKIVATLDVVSGGRAFCGLGAAWFEREHRAYGWEFPPLAERYDRLADALEILPLLWGPGKPPYAGRTIDVAEAICYPRPIQERIPILVGGSGERRTLRLVARHADAANLFGDPETVARKIAVLHEHCAEIDRDPREIIVTQLSSVRIDDRTNVEDHIGRFRQLAEVGVDHVFVSLPAVAEPDQVDRFAPVIDAFAT